MHAWSILGTLGRFASAFPAILLCHPFEGRDGLKRIHEEHMDTYIAGFSKTFEQYHTETIGLEGRGFLIGRQRPKLCRGGCEFFGDHEIWVINLRFIPQIFGYFASYE